MVGRTSYSKFGRTRDQKGRKWHFTHGLDGEISQWRVFAFLEDTICTFRGITDSLLEEVTCNVETVLFLRDKHPRQQTGIVYEKGRKLTEVYKLPPALMLEYVAKIISAISAREPASSPRWCQEGAMGKVNLRPWDRRFGIKEKKGRKGNGRKEGKKGK